MNAASGSVRSKAALAEHVLRHRLDAVDVAAEVNPIEVQLEDLRLREALLDHQREHRLLALARPVAARGREKQRARQLLRQCAAAFFEAAGAHVADDRAADGDRIDAEMRMKSVVFDGDDGVAQVGGDAVQRHVAPMLFKREPRLPIGPVEHRLADAARELVDREPVANDDDRGDERHHECATIAVARTAKSFSVRGWRSR